MVPQVRQRAVPVAARVPPVGQEVPASSAAAPADAAEEDSAGAVAAAPGEPTPSSAGPRELLRERTRGSAVDPARTGSQVYGNAVEPSTTAVGPWLAAVTMGPCAEHLASHPCGITCTTMRRRQIGQKRGGSSVRAWSQSE